MQELTVADLSEGELLAQIFPLLPQSRDELIGPGDDCAVMSTADSRYVVTMDMLIEGPDFRAEWSSPFDLGFKAAATNLADVAAMGARPTGLVVAIAAPPTTPVNYLLEIARGLNEFCTAHAPGCGVVGGDLSASTTFTIAVTALGSLDGQPALLRSGAQPGDIIAVAGRLGLAGLGLRELAASNAPSATQRTSVQKSSFQKTSAQKTNSQKSGAQQAVERGDTQSVAVQAQLRPTPPISLGVVASQAGATSGMDVSDSLALDAGRIAKASNVALVLDESTLDDMAAHLALECHVDAPIARQAMLFGGEDHALLMTFPSEVALPPGFVHIGHVLAASAEPDAPDAHDPHSRPAGVYLGELKLEEKGWNPFTDWV